MDEIRGDGEGLGGEDSPEREMWAADPIDTLEGGAPQVDDAVEVEVVLLANDEVSEDAGTSESVEGTAPTSPFRWYLLAPGVLAAAGAAALLVRMNAERSDGEGATPGLTLPVSPEALSGVGEALGGFAATLIARVQETLGMAPPPPPEPPTVWEQVQEVAGENWATIGAVAASIALTAAGAILDAQRRRVAGETGVPAPKEWYRFGR